MSKDKRDDPYEHIRIPLGKPTKVIGTRKDYKRNKAEEKKIIEEELEELYDD